jgi:hypothetical protein
MSQSFIINTVVLIFFICVICINKETKSEINHFNSTQKGIQTCAKDHLRTTTTCHLLFWGSQGWSYTGWLYLTFYSFTIFCCPSLRHWLVTSYSVSQDIKEKVNNLKYGLLETQKWLSRNLPFRNSNLEFNLKKTLGPPRTPVCVCGRGVCVCRVCVVD